MPQTNKIPDRRRENVSRPPDDVGDEAEDDDDDGTSL
jgi:hypothetical protein